MTAIRCIWGHNPTEAACPTCLQELERRVGRVTQLESDLANVERRLGELERSLELVEIDSWSRS